LRIWVVGLGTVGRWLLRALESQREQLERRYGFTPLVVGVANARHGFVYRAEGLDLLTVLGLAEAGRPLTDHPGVRHWPDALAGLRETEADVLVEVTQSPAADGEPGYAHMREALGRGLPVATSNKWPVALHGVELVGLARAGGVAFRAESTVMSGTPVLGALMQGLAGARPLGVRGSLNATANVVLTEMAAGTSYEAALAAAHEAGLAERDPAADVEGHDTVAKTMILAALVFGVQLRLEQVACRGITDVEDEAREAAAGGRRVRLVATLEYSGPGELAARVEPLALPVDDPLANVDGVMNAVVCRADPVGEVTIIGPGAGPALAGQGVLSDLIAIGDRSNRLA
jgi:homoserine dehydrogenase